MRSTLHDPLLTPENRLWRAVLEQAYVDAESGCTSGDGRCDGCDGSQEQLRARCYLRGDSKQDTASLTMVCGFAELPADRVLNWARRSYPRPRMHLASRSHAQSHNPISIGALEERPNCVRAVEPASV